jgi:parvulin-like peptidyl-prolyl isomerase
MDGLEKALENEGRSLRDFRETIRKQVITDSLVGQFVRSRIAIMSEEVEKYYKDHVSDFSTPEEVSLSEIIVAGGADDKEAENRANDLYSRMQQGESFAALASQYSQGPTANKGGGIGTNILAKWSPEIVAAIAGLKEGEISRPQKFKEGYVIYRVDSRKEVIIRPLDEVRNDIRQLLYDRKFEPEYRRFIAQLKEEAYIQDFSDTK